MKTYWRVEI